MNYGMHPLTRRRIAVIAQRMRTAPWWALPTLVQCWIKEVAR